MGTLLIIGSLYLAQRHLGGAGGHLDKGQGGDGHDGDQTWSPARARSLCAHMKSSAL